MGRSRRVREGPREPEAPRASGAQGGSPLAALLRVQQTAGNRATARLIQRQVVAGRSDRVSIQRDKQAGAGTAPRPRAFHGDGKHRPTDVRYARELGKQDMRRLWAEPKFTDEMKAELNAKLAWFTGSAHDAYLDEVRPVLIEAHSSLRRGLEQDVHDIYGRIQDIRWQRIEDWAGNADIPDSAVPEQALMVVIAIVSEGLGGVVYGLIEDFFEHYAKATPKLMQEFAELAGLEAGDLAAEAAFQRAVDGIRQDFADARDQAAKKVGEDVQLVSQRGNLAAYKEALQLHTRTEQHALEHNFNQTMQNYSDSELREKYYLLSKTLDELLHSPKAFERELTEGYIRLLDEAMMVKKTKQYGGSREAAFQGDPEAHTAELRPGNLVVWPTRTESGAPSQSIGRWDEPDLNFDVQVWGTGVNKLTMKTLMYAELHELPFTLAFNGLYGWGPDPDTGQITAPGIGFVRDAEDRIYLTTDAAGDEWLTSYYLRDGRKHSEAERKKNAPLGAHKLYEAIKHKQIAATLST
jgi:hypothetical protein